MKSRNTIIALLLATTCIPLIIAIAFTTDKNCIQVQASAYSIDEGQTDNTPRVAAWGKVLKSSDKVIAVSNNLLESIFPKGSLVKLDGLSGQYEVADKMGPRWQNRIDILMGEDKEAALKWGVKKIQVCKIK